MNPLEKEALEEALLQYVIKASLHESEDHVIETGFGVEPIRSNLVSDANERQIDVVLSEVISEDTIISFEAIYGPSTTNNIADVQAGLK